MKTNLQTNFFFLLVELNYASVSRLLKSKIMPKMKNATWGRNTRERVNKALLYRKSENFSNK